MKTKAIYFSVFTACLSALCYEMIHIRVFSYSLPPVLAYAGISIAMTGIGIGTVLLFFRPAALNRDLTRTITALLVLQSLTMVLAFVIFSRASWQTILDIQNNIISLIFKILLPCTLPYIFFGLFLGLIFSQEQLPIGRIYFFNLSGSGVGCILIVLLLLPLGGEKLVVLTALLAAIAGLTMSFHAGKALMALCLALILAEASSFAFAENLFPFSPDPIDAVGYGLRFAEKDGAPKPVKEFSEWNIVGKVEIWNSKVERLKVPETLDLRILSVDSGATTQLIEHPRKKEWGKALFEETAYGMAYAIRKKPEKVLVIGAGGGIDVDAALHWNAGHVTAVEINSSTVRAVQGPYASFLHWPELKNRVRVVHADGRSFVKGTSEKFDVIQLSGVDTMTVYATGSINEASGIKVSENDGIKI